ncbi:MAG: hypothetical protein QOF94_499 [Acidobacteriaceae bacterium]|jgi:hypothetical protein
MVSEVRAFLSAVLLAISGAAFADKLIGQASVIDGDTIEARQQQRCRSKRRYLSLIRHTRNTHGWSFHEHCVPIMTGRRAGYGSSLAQRHR